MPCWTKTNRENIITMPLSACNLSKTTFVSYMLPHTLVYETYSSTKRIRAFKLIKEYDQSTLTVTRACAETHFSKHHRWFSILRPVQTWWCEGWTRGVKMAWSSWQSSTSIRRNCLRHLWWQTMDPRFPLTCKFWNMAFLAIVSFSSVKICKVFKTESPLPLCVWRFSSELHALCIAGRRHNHGTWITADEAQWSASIRTRYNSVLQHVIAQSAVAILGHRGR